LVKRKLEVRSEEEHVAAQLRVYFGTLETLLERRPALVAYLELKSIARSTAYRHADKIIELAFPKEKTAADDAKKLERRRQREAAIAGKASMLRGRDASEATQGARTRRTKEERF